MKTLVETLADPVRRRAVVADGALLVQSEVASKTGFSGAAIKTGFKAVSRLSPSFVPRALEVLLPEFAPKVDPYFAKARESGDVSAYFVAHGTEIAEAMLQVTDARAARANHRGVLKIYEALRPRAVEHVVAAMPGLAQLVTKHVP